MLPLEGVLRSTGEVIVTEFFGSLKYCRRRSRAISFLLEEASSSTLASRNLFEELVYHYQLDCPEFSRIPFFHSPSSSISSAQKSENQPRVASGNLDECGSQESHSSDTQPGTPVTPVLPVMTTPGSTFCGKSSGKGEDSAARWLKPFTHEWRPLREADSLTPKAYLDY